MKGALGVLLLVLLPTAGRLLRLLPTSGRCLLWWLLLPTSSSRLLPTSSCCSSRLLLLLPCGLAAPHEALDNGVEDAVLGEVLHGPRHKVHLAPGLDSLSLVSVLDWTLLASSVAPGGRPPGPETETRALISTLPI